MKRILITGANGQLGCSFYNLLHHKYEIVNTSRSINNNRSCIYLDITNPIACKEVINLIKPDIILNFAALTNVDYCERNPVLTNEVNVTGLENLLTYFKKQIIHISSDYVFDGNNGPYSEEDSTNPINIYGISKLRSEQALLKNSSNSLIIRSNVIYDYLNNSGASFLNWVVDSLKNKKEINVVNDQINNPTWASSIAVVIDRAIELELTGLLHWGDRELLDRYEFAKKIADSFKLDKSLINPISTIDLKQDALRPLKCGLKTDYAQKILKLEPPSIKDCLNSIIKYT
mgnify:CR=1 FL=1